EPHHKTEDGRRMTDGGNQEPGTTQRTASREPENREPNREPRTKHQTSNREPRTENPRSEYNPRPMVDPLREEDPGSISRESRIEEMLLVGLDHYFSGQHELAISVWTRVLFLDRNHARARAYIERARGAIAERQREGEELLQTGAAAFHRGDADAARTLLTSAVERGVPSEEAQALLDRLDRLAPGPEHEPADRPPPREPQRRTGFSALPIERAGGGRWFAPVAAIALAMIALAAAGLFVLGPAGLLGPEPANPLDGSVRPQPA